ncbi:hypothetical protein DAI22_07g010250 [Oryza sativa Japonica Group]|nr:hypothetical protein DAI22_07g010250 [Oryza sativa Japonica Group]
MRRNCSCGYHQDPMLMELVYFMCYGCTDSGLTALEDDWKTKHISLDFQEVKVHGIEGVKHELKLFFRGNYFDGQLISG